MTEFKVGLLTLMTIGCIVYMSFRITSNQSGFGEHMLYRTMVRDASGIFPKTPIKVAGINAGRIKKIELQGNNALISFELIKELRIPVDSRLKIKTVGFLGDKYLEIVIGKSPDFLGDSGFIISEDGGGIERIVKDASEILGEVKAIVKNLRNTISPENRVSPVKKILDDAEKVAANLKDVSRSLKKVVAGNEEKLNAMIANLEDFSERLSYQLDKSKDDSVLYDVKEVLANAKNLTGDLKEIIRNVKNGEGTLGKILVEEEIADEVKETISSVKKIVKKVDSIRTELGLYTGYNTLYGSETEAGLRIYPAPERFYQLGIVTSKFGPIDAREKKTTVNGSTTTEETEIIRKNTFRFNIQLGRKIHDWSIRGGLIESTGGVGVDYFVQNWNTTFTTEVFDYRENKGINLRLASEIHIWNVLYGKAIADDLLIKATRNFTFSAGLKFTDEDLKGLLGFFL